jgi:hypothetical protein
MMGTGQRKLLAIFGSTLKIRNTQFVENAGDVIAQTAFVHLGNGLEAAIIGLRRSLQQRP